VSSTPLPPLTRGPAAAWRAAHPLHGLKQAHSGSTRQHQVGSISTSSTLASSSSPFNLHANKHQAELGASCHGPLTRTSHRPPFAPSMQLPGLRHAWSRPAALLCLAKQKKVPKPPKIEPLTFTRSDSINLTLEVQTCQTWRDVYSLYLRHQDLPLWPINVAAFYTRLQKVLLISRASGIGPDDDSHLTGDETDMLDAVASNSAGAPHQQQQQQQLKQQQQQQQQQRGKWDPSLSANQPFDFRPSFSVPPPSPSSSSSSAPPSTSSTSSFSSSSPAAPASSGVPLLYRLPEVRTSAALRFRGFRAHRIHFHQRRNRNMSSQEKRGSCGMMLFQPC
jgi:hypothetical protein